MNTILVIGSVHLDIIADYEPETAANIDKIGRLTYSIGGVGFNVVSNLMIHGHEAKFYSYINPQSLSGFVITKELNARRIPLGHVHHSTDLPESGFVAQFEKGKLKSAVSCVGIEYIQIDREDLRRALAASEVIVMDCNLSEAQLRDVLQMAKETNRKRLFATCVSESKVKRVANLGLPPELSFEAVVMNQAEALQVVGNHLNSGLVESATAICKTFSARAVVVTSGRAGHTVYLQSGVIHRFPPTTLPDVVNELGAGDALCAAICAYAQQNPGKEIDWQNCKSTIDAFVNRVLKSIPITVSLRKPPSSHYAESRETFWAGFMFISAVAFLAVGLICRTPFSFLLAFFGTPLLSGASGGVVRVILDRFASSVSRSSKSVSNAMILGSIAGFLTALLFMLAQRVSNQEGFKFDSEAVPDGTVWLIPFSLVLAFIGGLTLEAVFGRLRQTEVVRTDVLRQ